MIFVTVGSQLPFDRMIRAVDKWAGERGVKDVFAQVGEGAEQPQHIEWVETLDPEAFQAKLDACDAVVAHAGCGSILSALVAGKPLLVMPRRGHLRETRNDHQVPTAEQFHELHGVPFAMEEADMITALDDLLAKTGERPSIQDHASDQLLDRLREFIGG